MFQRYTRDRIRNLLIDRVNSTARDYLQATEELKKYDKREEEKNERLDTI